MGFFLTSFKTLLFVEPRIPVENPCEDLVYAIQMISELMIYNRKIRYIRWCELVNWTWEDEATGICVVPALANAGLAFCSRGLRYEYISRAICWCGFLEGASF